MAVEVASRPRAQRGTARAKLIRVAARLLREQGAEGVTTRAVAHRAGVQPPTIYRLFGDKDGLLDAVAERVLADYVADKARSGDDGDPLADLRAGWDAHVAFGLANPAVFALLTDPARAASPAAAAGFDVLRARVRRVAGIGRLRVSETHAVDMIHAAGVGTILTVRAVPAGHRPPGLAEAMYDAVARSILTDAPALGDDDTVAAAVAFRTVVPQLDALTGPERAVLVEWLDRAIDGQPVARPVNRRRSGRSDDRAGADLG